MMRLESYVEWGRPRGLGGVGTGEVLECWCVSWGGGGRCISGLGSRLRGSVVFDKCVREGLGGGEIRVGCVRVGCWYFWMGCWLLVGLFYFTLAILQFFWFY